MKKLSWDYVKKKIFLIKKKFYNKKLIFTSKMNNNNMNLKKKNIEKKKITSKKKNKELRKLKIFFIPQDIFLSILYEFLKMMLLDFII